MEGDCNDINGQCSELKTAEEENPDKYEQDECVDPSIGLESFKEDHSDMEDGTVDLNTLENGKLAEFNPDVCMVPTIGMEFESYVAAGKFYNSYAKHVGFETKIRQSRSNRVLGKWYVQFSCNKEGFRRAKSDKVAHRRTDRSDRPDIRCGCLATMKVKLTAPNKWKVFKVNLCHNHALSLLKIPHKRSHRQLEISAGYDNDECTDHSIDLEGTGEDPDDIGEDTTKLNVYEMEKSPECDQNACAEPIVGMEFDSHEDAGKFYDSYAKYVGFDTKIRQSRSNLKHGKRYVQFSCNKEGFKRPKSARAAATRRDRPDVRCGCLATMKIKLTGQSKWRVFHVNLVHNHEVGKRRAQKLKSHKQLNTGVKRRLLLSTTATMKGTSQPFVVQNEDHDQIPFRGEEYVERYKQKELDEGDVETMHNFFGRMQSRSLNFFYSLDLNDEGHVKNVFWVDARCRAAYEYFGDVVKFDSTYLSDKYNLKLALFVGVNHHGQSVLLGCGLLSNETKDSFIWLFKSWLKAMSNHPPNAIISEQSEAIQAAVIEVFPQANYRLCLFHIMKKLSSELGAHAQYEEIKMTMKNIICESLRVHEFEQNWNGMIMKYELQENEWLKTLYQLKEKWVPPFLRSGFWAGITNAQNDNEGSFFDNYVHPDTCLKEFVERYELVLNDKCAKESFSDFSNFNSKPSLDQVHWFEAQLVDIYTIDIFKKFQKEVNGMVQCYDMSPVHVDEAITTYVLKERIMDMDGKLLMPKEYEVHYNKAEVEVTCICNLFQFDGFLCRHALYILQNHGVVEIPTRYIAARWRKDYKLSPSFWYKSANLMENTAIQGHELIHKKCRKLVEESVISEKGYLVALQVLEEGWQKVRLENEQATKECGGMEHSDTNANNALDTTISWKSSVLCSNLQGRAEKQNSDSFVSNSERKKENNEKQDSCCIPPICDACTVSEPVINSTENTCKQRQASFAVSNLSKPNSSNEVVVTPTTHDLLSFSSVQQSITQMAPYLCGPPAFPRYVPMRYPSAPIMVDCAFIPFSQVSQQPEHVNDQLIQPS